MSLELEMQVLGLLDQLSAPDGAARAEAAQQLRGLGQSAMPILIEELRHGQTAPELVERAIRALTAPHDRRKLADLLRRGRKR
ncbi:MAG: hypothetical protein ACOYL5_18825 [Phototrophicaceae bacterium]|jgi:hypothetical protein